MLNFYRNEYAYHVLSVIQSEITKHSIPLEISDISYVNDPCSSFLISSETQSYQLFIPNSWRNEGEETTKFVLIKDEEYGDLLTFYLQFNTLEDFINYLRNNII